GREVQAPGDALARRSRPRRQSCRRGGLADRGVRPPAAALPRRVGADRGRRLGRAEDRGVPGREEAHLDMTALVFLEHHEGEIVKNALGVLSKAASFGGDVHGVVCGSGVRDLAGQAGEYGAERVYVADDPALAAPLPQPRVDVIASLVRDKGIDIVL